MKYKVSRENREPAYLQLYRQIREDITGHVYPYGMKLFSKRTLAAETGVSVITAEHACALLVDEGYIEARERSGFYVIYRDRDSFPVAGKCYGKGTLERGNSGKKSVRTEKNRGAETFPFSVLAKTMRSVLSEYGERLMCRQPNQGSTVLRESLAAYLARSRGMKVSPEQIVIGSGAEYLYSMIVQMVGRGEVYGLEYPSYSKIEKVYRANGVRCAHLQMDGWGILPEELKKTKAGVLHVTPFHSYPTGATASASRRREYVHWAEERSAIIIEDDFDSEFSGLTKSEDTLFSLEPEKTVIYMNTFSQSIAPSIRIGYMVLPEKRTEEFLEKISFYSCTVPAFEQLVIAELIRNGDFERHINRVRRMRRRQLRGKV